MTGRIGNFDIARGNPGGWMLRIRTKASPKKVAPAVSAQILQARHASQQAPRETHYRSMITKGVECPLARTMLKQAISDYSRSPVKFSSSWKMLTKFR